MDNGNSRPWKLEKIKLRQRAGIIANINCPDMQRMERACKNPAHCGIRVNRFTKAVSGNAFNKSLWIATRTLTGVCRIILANNAHKLPNEATKLEKNS